MTASVVLIKYLFESDTERQAAKSAHSSEYSSGSPDEPGIQRNRVCDANSAPVGASESAQLHSSTSSSMATYYRQCPLTNV